MERRFNPITSLFSFLARKPWKREKSDSVKRMTDEDGYRRLRLGSREVFLPDRELDNRGKDGSPERIVGWHNGGVYKCIDENRELLELLLEKAPDFLAEHPWVINWIEAQDEFLVDISKAIPAPSYRFDPRAPRDSDLGPFPRPWPIADRWAWRQAKRNQSVG